MSVNLSITWEDGHSQPALWGIGQRTAETWAALANEENLPMLSQIAFNGWPQFGSSDLETLLTECAPLRIRLAKEFPIKPRPGSITPVQQIEALIRWLEFFRVKTGWKGSFG